MKKTYITPKLKETVLTFQSLVAQSYRINSTTVTGSKALGREDNGWDIWGNDAEED